MKFQDPVLEVSHRLATAAAEVLDYAEVNPNDDPETLGPYLTAVREAGQEAARMVMRRLSMHTDAISGFYESYGFTDGDGSGGRTLTLDEAKALLGAGGL
jgi:hypothetical protein